MSITHGESLENSTKFDYMFPSDTWKKYDNFDEFERDFLKFHNKSNWTENQQTSLTLYYDRGFAPLIEIPSDVGRAWIPDPDFDTWKFPVAREDILATYNKGDEIKYAAENYFALVDGTLYETTSRSNFYDKITIRQVDKIDLPVTEDTS